MRQKSHGALKESRIPPSIRERETIVFDPTKEVSDNIKTLDKKKEAAKKRYRLRYDIEERCREHDIQDDARNNVRLKNRVNGKKYIQHLAKGTSSLFFAFGK
jgi:hypothetical protein